MGDTADSLESSYSPRRIVSNMKSLDAGVRTTALLGPDRVAPRDRPESISSSMGGRVGRGSPDPAAASVVRDRRRSGPFWSVAYAYLVIMLGTTLPSRSTGSTRTGSVSTPQC